MRLAQRLRLDASQAMDRGSVLHAWFELVEWLDDGEPDDEALRKAAGTLLCCGLDLSSLMGQFRKALAQPAMREVLSRATYERPARRGSAACIHADPKIARPEWIVSRECPFAVRDGDAIVSGKIDRLVVLRDGGQTVGADIVDFKTDAVSAEDPEALAARVAWYGPQLEAYRRAAATFLRIDPKEISTRLLFTEPGLVVPVD